MAVSTSSTNGVWRSVGERLSAYVPWAFGLWVGQFVFAIYACAAANFIFGIPLGSAVDVLLALQLCGPLLLLIIYVSVSILARDFSDLARFLTTVLAYALNPFAAILGYLCYAYLDHVQLIAASFVYANFMSHLHEMLVLAAHAGARLAIPYVKFIGSSQFFNWANFTFGLAGIVLSAIQSVLRTRSSAGARTKS